MGASWPTYTLAFLFYCINEWVCEIRCRFISVNSGPLASMLREAQGYVVDPLMDAAGPTLPIKLSKASMEPVSSPSILLPAGNVAFRLGVQQEKAFHPLSDGVPPSFRPTPHRRRAPPSSRERQSRSPPCE